MGLNDLESAFPFVGGIDITLDYEVTGTMDPPLAF